MQASMLELSGKQLFHNAWILTVAEWKKSGIFLVESLIFAGCLLGIAPWSLFFLIPGLAIYQLAACGTLGRGITARVVEPYEKRRR